MPYDLNTASLLPAVHGNIAPFLSLTHMNSLPIPVLAQLIQTALPFLISNTLSLYSGHSMVCVHSLPLCK
jgi:hypothetical protein